MQHSSPIPSSSSSISKFVVGKFPTPSSSATLKHPNPQSKTLALEMQHPSPASDLSPLSDSESVASVDSVADDDGKAARKAPVHQAPPLKKMKTHEAKDDCASPSLSVEHIEGGYVVVPIALIERLIVSTIALTKAQEAFKKAHLEYQQAFREQSRAFNDLLNYAIEVEDSQDPEADELDDPETYEPDDSDADEPDDSEADEPVVDETEEVSVVDNAAMRDQSDEDDSWIEPSSP